MFSPQFTITSNLLIYISRIEAAKALIDQAPLVPSWDAKFRDEALSRTVHFGTKIEGNDLTQEQAQQIVRMDSSIKPQDVAEKAGMLARDRDIQEVINYRNVIKWIDTQQLEVTDSNQVLTVETLKKLHYLTMQQLIEEKYIGAFRDKQVIVRSAADGEVAFRLFWVVDVAPDC